MEKVNMTNYTTEQLTVIHNVLQELIDRDFRSSFNDGVGQRVRMNLIVEFPDSDIYVDWWKDYCSLGFNESDMRKSLGDGLYDLLIEARKLSKGEGAFQMCPYTKLD